MIRIITWVSGSQLFRLCKSSLSCLWKADYMINHCHAQCSTVAPIGRRSKISSMEKGLGSALPYGTAVCIWRFEWHGSRLIEDNPLLTWSLTPGSGECNTERDFLFAADWCFEVALKDTDCEFQPRRLTMLVGVLRPLALPFAEAWVGPHIFCCILLRTYLWGFFVLRFFCCFVVVFFFLFFCCPISITYGLMILPYVRYVEKQED